MTRSAVFAGMILVAAAAARCGEPGAPALGPTVTGVSPNRGPLAGGTIVTITGTHFRDITGVTLGGIPLSGLTVVSEVRITGTTQPGVSTGTQEVVVTSERRGSGRCAACFNYTQFPGPLLLRLGHYAADSSRPLGALLLRVEGGPSAAIAASGPAISWTSSATAPRDLIVSGDLTPDMVLATISVPDTQEAVRSRYSISVRQATGRRAARYQQLNSASYPVSITPQ